MTCQHVRLPDGTPAIVCGSKPRAPRCSCGKPADLLCDWRVPTRASGTCDKPICRRCAASPARGKDICPAHTPALRAWQRKQAQAKGQPASSSAAIGGGPAS